jgi:hypothetical protein
MYVFIDSQYHKHQMLHNTQSLHEHFELRDYLHRPLYMFHVPAAHGHRPTHWQPAFARKGDQECGFTCTTERKSFTFIIFLPLF